MARDIPLRCTCGTLRGVALGITPSVGSRVVCHCADCQTYAHYLKRADDLLDPHGGTDIFVMAPARLRLTDGLEQLHCVRQSPKGAMRWHARCCGTPVGNGPSNPGIPFVGVPHLLMDHSERSRDADLGPVQARVHGRHCRGEIPPGTHPKTPFGLLVTMAAALVTRKLKGEASPSPFFDDRGEPVVTPTVITREERDQLRGLLG
jgi:hypothetical protein